MRAPAALASDPTTQPAYRAQNRPEQGRPPEDRAWGFTPWGRPGNSPGHDRPSAHYRHWPFRCCSSPDTAPTNVAPLPERWTTNVAVQNWKSRATPRVIEPPATPRPIRRYGRPASLAPVALRDHRLLAGGATVKWRRTGGGAGLPGPGTGCRVLRRPGASPAGPGAARRQADASTDPRVRAGRCARWARCWLAAAAARAPGAVCLLAGIQAATAGPAGTTCSSASWLSAARTNGSGLRAARSPTQARRGGHARRRLARCAGGFFGDPRPRRAGRA